jgi:competence protein ComEC
MQGRMFFGALIAFAVGVGMQTVHPISFAVAVWVLFLGFVVAVVWRKNSSAVFAPHLLLASILLVFISLGLLRTEVASWQFGVSPLEQSVGETVSLTGVIALEPDYRERFVHLYVKTDTDKVLVSTDRLTAVSYGDVVTVTGKLERPTEFQTDLGRTFDYPGYLRARGVEYRMSFAAVEVAGSGEGNRIVAMLLAAKRHFITSFERVVPEPAVALGNGLLLGVQSGLGKDIEEDFRRTGIIHIVVLSGYNVMLVVAFILFCFAFILPMRWRLVAGVIAIVAFALIVGLSATVVRASIMASLVLFAQAIGRQYEVLRALCLAGAVMLVLNPYLLIYDIGFQLSFMATLGLILFIPKFESTVIQKNTSIGAREFFLATVATQIAVLPLLMYHIGEVSLIAVVVNVLILPMVPIAMLLSFITGVLGLVTISLAGVVGYFATLSLQYILVVAAWFAAVPLATVSVPEFSALGVFLLYGVMFLLWYIITKKRSTKQDSLAGWTIETEPESDEAKPGSRPPSDVPVFFR